MGHTHSIFLLNADHLSICFGLNSKKGYALAIQGFLKSTNSLEDLILLKVRISRSLMYKPSNKCLVIFIEIAVIAYPALLQRVNTFVSLS